jgi:hypothetical protein
VQAANAIIAMAAGKVTTRRISAPPGEQGHCAPMSTAVKQRQSWVGHRSTAQTSRTPSACARAPTMYVVQMTQDLLIGIVALIAAGSLFMVGPDTARARASYSFMPLQWSIRRSS